jgi:hypothetical protein
MPSVSKTPFIYFTCAPLDQLHKLSVLPVFNGDFVDRGSWSTEVVLTVFALKWYMPHKVFVSPSFHFTAPCLTTLKTSNYLFLHWQLNRGNHETADMNKVYGFEGEVGLPHLNLAHDHSFVWEIRLRNALLTNHEFYLSRPRKNTVNFATSCLKKYSVPVGSSLP